MWKSERRDKLKNRTPKAPLFFRSPTKHKYLCKRMARDKTFFFLSLDKMNVSHLSGIFHLSTNYPVAGFVAFFSTYLFNRFHADGAGERKILFNFISSNFLLHELLHFSSSSSLFFSSNSPHLRALFIHIPFPAPERTHLQAEAAHLYLLVSSLTER